MSYLQIAAKSVAFATALIAISAPAYAQLNPDRDAKLKDAVTLSEPGATVGNVLNAIGSQIGVRFDTAPQTALEVLTLRVKDVPAIELLNRIAKITAGTWRQESTGYRLMADSVARQTELKLEVAKRTKAIQQAMAGASGGAGSGPMTDDQAASIFRQGRAATSAITAGSSEVGASRLDRQALEQMRQISEQGPTNRALMNLLNVLGAGTLAQVVEGGRAVYSTTPNRMQLMFPNGAQEVVRQWVADYDVWLRASQGQPASGSYSGLINNFAPNLSPKPLKGGISKVLLIVSRPVDINVLICELLIADGEGSIVSRANKSFSLTPRSQAATDIAEPGESEESPLQLNDQGKELLKLLAAARSDASGGNKMMFVVASNNGRATLNSGNDAGPDLPDSLVQLLARPDLHDPIGLVLGDLLVRSAESKGKQLIASLPDSSLTNLHRLLSTGLPNPSRYLRTVGTVGQTDVTEDGGWITIAPTLPFEARSKRIDRTALARLISRAVKDGRIGLDDLAAYATYRPTTLSRRALDTELIDMLSRSIANSDSANGSLGEDSATLRFYAGLTPLQRQAVAANKPIPIGSLTTNQSAALNYLVFQTMAGPNIKLPEKQGQDSGQIFTSITVAAGGQTFMTGSPSGGQLLSERTEALPNGIPSNGFANIQVRSNEAYFARNSQTGATRIMTAEDMALAKSFRTNKTVKLSGTDFDQYRPVSMSEIELLFQLHPNVSMDRSLEDIRGISAGNWVTYEELPASFRQRVDELSKNFGGIGIKLDAGGRQSVPPPPPQA